MGQPKKRRRQPIHFKNINKKGHPAKNQMTFQRTTRRVAEKNLPPRREQ
jgi:hypothetical protein